MNDFLKSALEGLEIAYLMARLFVRDLVGLPDDTEDLVDKESK